MSTRKYNIKEKVIHCARKKIQIEASRDQPYQKCEQWCEGEFPTTTFNGKF